MNIYYSIWKKTFKNIHQLSCFVGHPVCCFDPPNQSWFWILRWKNTIIFICIFAHKINFPIYIFAMVGNYVGVVFKENNESINNNYRRSEFWIIQRDAYYRYLMLAILNLIINSCSLNKSYLCRVWPVRDIWEELNSFG